MARRLIAGLGLAAYLCLGAFGAEAGAQAPYTRERSEPVEVHFHEEDGRQVLCADEHGPEREYLYAEAATADEAEERDRPSVDTGVLIIVIILVVALICVLLAGSREKERSTMTSTDGGGSRPQAGASAAEVRYAQRAAELDQRLDAAESALKAAREVRGLMDQRHDLAKQKLSVAETERDEEKRKRETAEAAQAAAAAEAKRLADESKAKDDKLKVARTAIVAGQTALNDALTVLDAPPAQSRQRDGGGARGAT